MEMDGNGTELYFASSQLETVGSFPVEEQLANVSCDGGQIARQTAPLLARQQATVALDKLVKLHPHRIARLADANRLQHSRAAQLFQNDRQVESHRRLVPVGFDAAQKPRITPKNNPFQQV